MPRRRFPLAPVVAVLLQVVAVITLIVLAYLAVQAFQQGIDRWSGGQSPYGYPMPKVEKLGERLQTLIPAMLQAMLALGIPALAWAVADGLLALREIEFCTRRAAPAESLEEASGEEEPGAAAK